MEHQWVTIAKIARLMAIIAVNIVIGNLHTAVAIVDLVQISVILAIIVIVIIAETVEIMVNIAVKIAIE